MNAKDKLVVSGDIQEVYPSLVTTTHVIESVEVIAIDSWDSIKECIDDDHHI